ncbi:hypothetical protein GKZ89_05470 [Bacillus mangrovi]|uniref:DUF4025 domain-containing protein n=1 Tax=Metabacillus mangrovi TaxID=1491830 RepID=A0A7X2S3S0_9BACI|nr:hypothetical protein [Metabacillus mangrovi]MTH52852.1 hypothetical protein [Metabacillus mangrovi]
MKKEPNNESIQFDTEAGEETSQQIKNAYESGVIEQNFNESFTADQEEKSDQI